MTIDELETIADEMYDLMAAFEFEDRSLIGKSRAEIEEYRRRNKKCQ